LVTPPRHSIQEEYVRKKSVLGALVGVLALSVAAIAIANPASDTTLDVTTVVKPKKAGTKANPKPEVLTLTIAGGTVSGTGQPSTSTQINSLVPDTFIQQSRKWPKSKRCDIDEVNNAKSDSVCPKGSKVGFGSSQAKAGNGSIIQDLELTAFVIKNGNIGFFLNGSTPVQTQVMLESKVKGRQLNTVIPPNVQEPVPGFATGITLLKVTFNGKVKVKGETIGILESKGCKNHKWKFTITNIYRDGSKKDSDTVACNPTPKKK
jgi:hypothetical protein